MDKERLIEIIRTGTYTGEHLEELAELVQTYPWFGLPRFLRLKVYEQMGETPEAGELNHTVVFSSDRKHLYKWVTGAFDSMIGTSESGSTELEFLDSDGEAFQEDAIADESTDAKDEAGSFLLLDEDDGGEEVVDGESVTEGEMLPEEVADEDGTDEGDAAGEILPEGVADGDVAVADSGEDEGMAEEDALPEDVVEDEDDADARPIPEKDESEMEEPELEEPEAIPVIDPMDDDDDEPADDQETNHAVGTANGEAPGTEPSTDIQATGREELSGGTGQQPPAGDDSSVQPVNTENGRSASANPSTALIERFLEREPGVIRADHQTSLEGDVSEGSVQEDDGLITDTLAKIYVKQGLHAKAIYAYERLSLKYPEKSAYFAAQIEKIKNNANI